MANALPGDLGWGFEYEEISDPNSDLIGESVRTVNPKLVVVSGWNAWSDSNTPYFPANGSLVFRCEVTWNDFDREDRESVIAKQDEVTRLVDSLNGVTDQTTINQIHQQIADLNSEIAALNAEIQRIESEVHRLEQTASIALNSCDWTLVTEQSSITGAYDLWEGRHSLPDAAATSGTIQNVYRTYQPTSTEELTPAAGALAVGYITENKSDLGNWDADPNPFQLMPTDLNFGLSTGQPGMQIMASYVCAKENLAFRGFLGTGYYSSVSVTTNETEGTFFYYQENSPYAAGYAIFSDQYTVAENIPNQNMAGGIYSYTQTTYYGRAVAMGQWWLTNFSDYDYDLVDQTDSKRRWERTDASGAVYFAEITMGDRVTDWGDFLLNHYNDDVIYWTGPPNVATGDGWVMVKPSSSFYGRISWGAYPVLASFSDFYASAPPSMELLCLGANGELTRRTITPTTGRQGSEVSLFLAGKTEYIYTVPDEWVISWMAGGPVAPASSGSVPFFAVGILNTLRAIIP